MQQCPYPSSGHDYKIQMDVKRGFNCALLHLFVLRQVGTKHAYIQYTYHPPALQGAALHHVVENWKRCEGRKELAHTTVFLHKFDFETVLPASKTTADCNFPVSTRFELTPSRNSVFCSVCNLIQSGIILSR